MILVDGEKYACVQCIRGHRSSTCKHSKRPLVQVRSRGRPSLNQTHRIAVTESEIILSRDQVNIQDNNNNNTNSDNNNDNDNNQIGYKSHIPIKQELDSHVTIKSCCSSKSQQFPNQNINININQSQNQNSCCSSDSHKGCQSSSNGVILLKASKRQFVDVVAGNLDFVGPYKDSSTNSFKLPNSKKQKHIRSQKCQSDTLHSKLRALKTLKVNKVNLPININNNDYNNHIRSNQHNEELNFQGINQSNEFDHLIRNYNNNNNSDQIISNQLNNLSPPQERFQYFQQQLQSTSQFSSLSSINLSNNIKTEGPSSSTTGSTQESEVFEMFLGEGCATECNCGKECTCPGCLIHRTTDELKDYGLLDSSTTGSTPSDFTFDDGTIRSSSRNNITTPRSYQLPQISGNYPPNDQIHQQEQPQPQPQFTPPPLESHSNLTPETQSQNGLSEVSNEQMISFVTIDELFSQDLMDEDCCCEESDCKCFNCSKHGITNGVRIKDGVKVFEVDELFNNVPNLINIDDFKETVHDCGCSPEECECYNCPMHGIYNGTRINSTEPKVLT